MKKLIIYLSLIATVGFSADVILGRLQDLTWTGTGADRVASFATEPSYSPASDFTFTTNASLITITSYIGAGGVVRIPPYINGFPVDKIGNGVNGFATLNTTINTLYIPDSVTTINSAGLADIQSISSIFFGVNVSFLGDFALYQTSATKVYFKGNAPTLGTLPFLNINCTIYYKSTSIGFTNPFGGKTTAEWTSYPNAMP